MTKLWGKLTCEIVLYVVDYVSLLGTFICKFEGINEELTRFYVARINVETNEVQDLHQPVWGTLGQQKENFIGIDIVSVC